MLEQHRTQRTFFFELWRAAASGILETAGTTFLLLIALRWYNAGPLAKGLLAGSGSFGLLLTPLVVTVVTALRWPVSRAAAQILALGAVGFFAAAAIPSLQVFVACSVIAMTAPAAIVPLLTQMYQENYPEAERGSRFARTFMVRIATAVVFSKLAGDVLTKNLQWFPALLMVFGAALAFASVCLWQCPTQPIAVQGRLRPLRGFGYVGQDSLFRRTLLCWMLMGTANLMMLSLRVEYLANSKYGLALTSGTVALLTGVVPNLARLALSPLWGRWFDRMNFFTLRVALNIGFGIGIFAFFMADSFAGLIGGAIIYGISCAGGDVAWSLWVTKFAPPERVADYMSVHTFLTGVRGVLAPIAAFFFVSHYSLASLTWISSALMAASTLLLIPEIKFGRRARPSAILVEEISD